MKHVETSNLVLLVDPALDPAITPPPLSIGTLPDDEDTTRNNNNSAAQAVGQVIGLATQLERNQTAASHSPLVVTAVATAHLELVQRAPKLSSLDSILRANTITANNTNTATGIGIGIGIPGDELATLVQASDAELDVALLSRDAVEIDGFWYGLDAEYLGTLLELILLTLIERGWRLDNCPVPQVVEAMGGEESGGYPPAITRFCLLKYQKKDVQRHDHDTDQDIDCIALDTQKIATYFGIRLLRQRSGSGTIPVDEFVVAWKASVPEACHEVFAVQGGGSDTTGIHLVETLLRGQCLVISKTAPPCPSDTIGTGNSSTYIPEVRYLPGEELPRDAGSRFSRLFAFRSAWELRQLEPYISGLAGPGETTEMLLLKYARASQQRPEDPVTYSAR